MLKALAKKDTEAVPLTPILSSQDCIDRIVRVLAHAAGVECGPRADGHIDAVIGNGQSARDRVTALIDGVKQGDENCAEDFMAGIGE